MLKNELYHHGILGQKWGKRNGPPYPLRPSAHSASEKKAGWKKSVEGNKKKNTVGSGGGATELLNKELKKAQDDKDDWKQTLNELKGYKNVREYYTNYFSEFEPNEYVRTTPEVRDIDHLDYADRKLSKKDNARFEAYLKKEWKKDLDSVQKEYDKSVKKEQVLKKIQKEYDESVKENLSSLKEIQDKKDFAKDELDELKGYKNVREYYNNYFSNLEPDEYVRTTPAVRDIDHEDYANGKLSKKDTARFEAYLKKEWKKDLDYAQKDYDKLAKEEKVSKKVNRGREVINNMDMQQWVDQWFSDKRRFLLRQ